MPGKKNITTILDASEEKLTALLSDFSIDAAIKWLRKKFASFDTSRQATLPVGDSKNEQSYFADIQRLGYVTELRQDKKNEINKPLVIVAIQMQKDLSERTSRSVQFNCAKRILKEEVERGQHQLTGMPSQGIFFFYDSNGHFRISLVSGEVENRRFKFNEAKRQSFFVEPGTPNNIVKRRLNPPLKTYAELKDAFSVEKLTKEFYDNLFKWYEWAMDEKTRVTFSNHISRDEVDGKQLSEALIRLITRLMFVWFVRQRGIVPQEFFDQDAMSQIIRDFDPASMEQDNYYRVILQNLFFATLNCQPAKRKFFRSFHGMSNERGVKTCYRYAEELLSPEDFMKRMEPVPFLNCALFDCLDKVERQEDGGQEILLDGFSSKESKRAHLPNGLFFDEDKGLVKLFNFYEFTVDENNADDSDVALDPELLGKVFENLLGAFNPETQETARKATGSFYTPREIVDYMVEESLRNYLKSKVQSADDARLDDLFDRTLCTEGAPTKFDRDEVNALLDALYNCKILDPACGSGAFPMGVLHCMVRLFCRLDPGNIRQREIILQRYREETAEVQTGLSEAERTERVEILQNQLKEGQLYPDYARKLYLIENCIYGVDIQPIATQISKLRFFISLLCDQLRTSWDPQAANYGLLSLPNLEAKFVCANTLLALPKVDGGELALSAEGVQELKEALQKNRHKIFFARTAETKAKYKAKDQELRDRIKETVRTQLSTPDAAIIAAYEKVIAQAEAERQAVAEPKIELQEQIVGGDLFTEGEKEWVEVDVNAAMRKTLDDRIKNARRIIAEERNKANLKSTGSTAIDRLAAMVAGWDPYDQNASSDFFDSEWMFNVKAGFDIVIGNPPYIQLQNNGGELANLYQGCGFSTFTRSGDIYSLFYERGHHFLHEHGFLCYITSNKWMRAGYGESTRKFFAENTNPIRLIDFAGQKVFESATVDTNVLLFAKEKNTGDTLACQIRQGCRRNLTNYIRTNSARCSFNTSGSWAILSPVEMSIRKKVESAGTPLKDWDISINYGIKTGCNEAFIIDEKKRQELIAADPKCEEIIRPILRGRDIKRYGNNFAGYYLIATFPAKHIDITKYPAVMKYLLSFGKEKLAQSGEKDVYGIKGNNARKKTGNKWFETQDQISYWEDFSKPKIMYPNMTKYMPFYLDKLGFVQNDKVFMITGENLDYLVVFLNSMLFKFCFRNNFPELLGGTRELRKIFFDKIPVKRILKKDNTPFAAIARNIQNGGPDQKEKEQIAETMIFDLYGISEEERAFIKKSEESFLAGETEAEPQLENKPNKKSNTTVKKPRRSSDEEEYLE